MAAFLPKVSIASTMNLQIGLNSESHCDYWKTLAAQASYKPNGLAEIAENQLATVERTSYKSFAATPKACRRGPQMQAMDAVDNWLDIQNVNLLENSASLSGPLVYRQSQ